jgi:hypothetical protein
MTSDLYADVYVEELRGAADQLDDIFRRKAH